MKRCFCTVQIQFKAFFLKFLIGTLFTIKPHIYTSATSPGQGYLLSFPKKEKETDNSFVPFIIKYCGISLSRSQTSHFRQKISCLFKTPTQQTKYFKEHKTPHITCASISLYWLPIDAYEDGVLPLPV